MIVKEKKQYIAPQARSVELDGTALLAGSDLTSGGDNTQPGAPTVAEGKHGAFDYEDDSEDYDY